jgi:hypothetical protein
MSSGTVTVGGKEYTLTPLTIAEYKKSQKLSSEFKQLVRDGNATPEAANEFLNATVAIIHASIKRSDPRLTLEALEEAVTYLDAFDILVDLVRISLPNQAPGKSPGLVQ